jgi:hypothetical protein
VINRSPLSRSSFDPSGIPPDSNTLGWLVEAGLLQREATGEEAFRWAAHGLSRSDCEKKLAGIEREHAAAILQQWQRSYTVAKSALLDRSAVTRMLEAGLLAEDRPGLLEMPSYLRWTDVSWSEARLIEAIREAGVEEPGSMVAAWRGDVVVSPRKITSFLPPFDLRGGGLLAVWSLVVFLGMQWWPGAQGDGFLAQRLFSCKNEKHSVFAMLWFNLAHFVLRPWPWIVVGVGSLFLIPDITRYGAHYDQEYAYVVMLMKYLPDGMRGLMVAALMAAYMSTISTHVNFGASYVINDLYLRFYSFFQQRKADFDGFPGGYRGSGGAGGILCAIFRIHRRGMVYRLRADVRSRGGGAAEVVLVANQRLVGAVRHGRLAHSVCPFELDAALSGVVHPGRAASLLSG